MIEPEMAATMGWAMVATMTDDDGDDGDGDGDDGRTMQNTI